MGFKAKLDRLRSTRVGKPSKFEKKEHEENSERYSNKKFHHDHNADKPKSLSLRDKLVKKALAKGKELQEKSKQHAIDELKKSKKSKKNKTKKSKPESKEPTPDSSNNFDFGFGNQSNEQFGFGMFTPQKEGKKPRGEEVDWTKVFNFRIESDSKRRKYNPYGSYDF